MFKKITKLFYGQKSSICNLNQALSGN